MAFILAKSASASPGRMAADTTVDLYETEKTTLLKRIEFEKSRIANDYHSADIHLFNLVDSVMGFILEQPVSNEKRNIYLSRLQIFLANISRYYSDSYLKSGTYLAALGYYPVMIEWDQKGELLRNLKRYSSFSIKATKLIPTDAVAEDFLTDFMTEHPDDIFRYVEEFDDRKCAMKILEKATKIAPESAKRYYITLGAVPDILHRSKDPFIKKSFEIYNRYGLRSRAYLLLDAIVKKEMSIDAADSIGNKSYLMFARLLENTKQNDANISYSNYRYLDNYSVELMRKMNHESETASTSELEIFKSQTPDGMFVLLGYGYKEVTLKTFQSLMTALRSKSGITPISGVMIMSMDKSKLKDLVIYCDQNQMLDALLGLVDDDRKNYLLGLATLEEKEGLIPPFKTFGKEKAPAKKLPENKNINAVAKARPPKPVAAETVAAERTETKTDLASAVPAAPRSAVNAHTLATSNISSISCGTAMNTDVTAVEAKRDVLPVPVADVPPIHITLDDKTRAVISLKKNILRTIQDIPAFVNKEYAEEVLLYAAQKEPDEVFKKIEAFKTKFYCIKILEQCALNAPVSVKRYLYNPNHPVNYILQYSKNPTVKKILEINKSIGYHSKPLLLVDDIISGKMTAKDAVTISGNPNQLFSAVVSIISRPQFIGRYSIDREMRDYSLRFIREINDKIATGAPLPFASVENFSSTDLYFLMLYGRDEVFTSTFTGLFDRFMLKLPKDDGDAFLNGISYNQFRDFLSLCSNFGTMPEFLAKFSPEAKGKLLTAYITNLEAERDDLSTIVLIAEAMSNLHDNQLLATLQTNVKKEYDRVKASNNQVGISIYGVLSSMISGNAKVETNWYRTIAQQFSISPAGTLASESLFTDGNCVEQMYFYDDEDGRSSFTNFMNTYKNQSAWVIDDKNTFVRIYSRTAMSVQIFANKPEFEQTGMNAITTYLKEKNLVSTVIVHRGHSFHTEATLEKILPTARLVFVGSCGGFYKISMALENAPEAHIISTKQVGTKGINDVMLFALNENIRTGKDIEWNDFWDKMHDKLGGNQYFSDYVPPHKNLEAIFIRSYYKILGA